jgi:cytochrome c-type biogenesis protein CcmH
MSRRLRAVLMAAALSLVSGPLAAAAPPPPPPTAFEQQLVHTDRFRNLAAELRCLVCQNQSLADSNAELAVDLRDEVVRLMAAGHTDRQIKHHLVERYGDFVLYRPTFAARNWALWAGPFLMMAIGAMVVWRVGRRRPATEASDSLSEADAERVRRILGDDPPR